jgi:predicted porin
MKKTLMALAVGAAVAAPAAYADVTISGAINMGLYYINEDDASPATTANTLVTGNGAQGENTNGVTTTYSNITISSVDDLGGGLKLDFAAQMDWGGINTAGAGLSNRNSHIGLVSESWGGVWYGTNENIYERYFYSIDPIDGAMGTGGNLTIMGNPGRTEIQANGANCSDFTIFANGNDCGFSFYRRTSHTIWYDSPNFNGITFGVFTTLQAYKTANTDPRIWGAGVKYVGTGLPLQVWAAYQQHDDVSLPNTGGTTSDDTGIQVGAGYTLGDIFIFANYEMLEYNSDNVAPGVNLKYERDAFGVGIKWNLASGYVGAQYIQALEADCSLTGVSCDASDTEATMISAGYFHTLSKQTQGYFAVSWLDNGDLAAYRHPDAGGGGGTTGPGADSIKFTVGLKHVF